MDFGQRLAGLMLLWGVACATSPPQAGSSVYQIFALGGRVGIVALEATDAAARADASGARLAAVGLFQALGRGDDNVGQILFGEHATALQMATRIAVERARPGGEKVEEKLDINLLRGPASPLASVRKAQSLLEQFDDKDETTILYLGTTTNPDELPELDAALEICHGRGWRFLVAPMRDPADDPVFAALAGATRGAIASTEGGARLLRGVLELAADFHALFRRVEPVDAPVRTPETARRLLFVALTPPGSDLVGARTADQAGEPVTPLWVLRPGDDRPPAYRVAELLDPAYLQSRAWQPRTVGTPPVDAFVELPVRILLAHNQPGVDAAPGTKLPVRLTLHVDGNAMGVLAPRLSAEAGFEGATPTILDSETSAEGSLTFAKMVPVPPGARPTLVIKLTLKDPNPEVGTWEWIRRVRMRPAPTATPPLELEPPELDVPPAWEDAPPVPAPLTLRAREPLRVEPEATAALDVTPAKLELGPEAPGTLQVAVARGTSPGPVTAQLSLRVRDASGRELAGTLVAVRGAVIRWLAPPPITFGARKPGESASLTLPPVWSPIPVAAAIAGHLEGPDGARVELTCFAEPDGGCTVAALVPEDAPLGRYVGVVSCGATGLPPREIPATLDVGEGLPPMPPPTIAAVEPAVGPPAGGTRLTIRGAGFQDRATVEIGGRPARVEALTPDAIVAEAPPSPAAGAADVLVTNPDGQRALAMGAFIYDPDAPTTSPLVASPPALALAGDAGTEVAAEVTIANATADRLPAHAELTDLRAADGDDLISARFDCAADVVAAVDGNPAVVRYRVRLPADVASGRYLGTMRLRDQLTGNDIEVLVEVRIP